MLNLVEHAEIEVPTATSHGAHNLIDQHPDDLAASVALNAGADASLTPPVSTALEIFCTSRAKTPELASSIASRTVAIRRGPGYAQ